MIISRMSVRNTAVWLSSLVVALSLWLPVDAAVFGDGSEQHSRSIDMQDVTFHAGDPERGLPPSISIPIFQTGGGFASDFTAPEPTAFALAAMAALLAWSYGGRSRRNR